jgi:hypothetical protein
MSLHREQWSLYGPQRGPRLGRRAGASGVTGRVGTKDLAAPQGATGLLLIPLPPKRGVFVFHVENTGTWENKTRLTRLTRSPRVEIHLASELLPSPLSSSPKQTSSLCLLSEKWTGQWKQLYGALSGPWCHGALLCS